jgi:hypothetical protein
MLRSLYLSCRQAYTSVRDGARGASSRLGYDQEIDEKL